MKLTPTNSKLEIEGAELTYYGTTFLVARAGNINFKKVFKELMKPHKKAFDNGTVGDDLAKDLMIEAYATSILVGWDKLVDVDGKEWEYSVENAKSLLNDDNDLYDAVSSFSEDIDNYIIENGKELLGK